MNSSSAIFTWQLFQVCASTGMFNELHYPYWCFNWESQYSWFLLFVTVGFYKITTNIELMNATFLREI
jgi:hypothetical protein